MKIHQSIIPGMGTNEDVFGLPAKAITLSNSERLATACDRKWYFSYVERLRSEATTPLRIGSCWAVFKESVTTWWMRTDNRPFPKEGQFDVIDEHVEKWKTQRGDFLFSIGNDDTEDKAIDDFVMTLTRMIEGYFEVNGRTPPRDVRILSPELALSAPILNPQGEPFRPQVPMAIAEDGSCAFAEHGDENVEMIRWPWYSVGKLDCVIQYTGSGMLGVWEDKSTKTPSRYFDSLSIDPQVAGYEHLLHHACLHGKFGPELQHKAQQGRKVVAGYIYEVTNTTKQQDPVEYKQRARKKTDPSGPLPHPGLSRNRGANTPSWRYIDAVNKAGLDIRDYEEHISHCRHKIDSKLYHRESNSVGREQVERYKREVFAVARAQAQKRRDAYRTPRNEVEWCFPRNPICKAPGSGCQYRGPCAQDVPETRASFTVGEKKRWVPKELAIKPDDNQNLPF